MESERARERRSPNIYIYRTGDTEVYIIQQKPNPESNKGLFLEIQMVASEGHRRRCILDTFTWALVLAIPAGVWREKRSYRLRQQVQALYS